MADAPLKTVERDRSGEPVRGQRGQKSSEKPVGMSGSREKISGTLAEGQKGQVAEGIESGEIRETMAEGGEIKDDGTKTSNRGRGDGGSAANGSTPFTFDEKNLPEVPEMIRKIEEFLRAEIRQLEKRARYYKGGFFRKPDYHKHSEAVVKIREKTVLLKRLIHMAIDAVKKLFLQMFGVRT